MADQQMFVENDINPDCSLTIRSKGTPVEYPGIYVDSAFGPIVTVEWTDCRNNSNTPGIQVLVWSNSGDEEPNYFIEVD